MGVSTLLFLGAVYLCTALAAPMDDGTYSNSTLRFHDERLSNSTRFLERRWKSGKSNAEKGVNDFEQARIPDDMFLIGYKRIPAKLGPEMNEKGLIWKQDWETLQLGPGFYISDRINRWKQWMFDHEDDWYCRVYCDYQVLRAWPKMWIPKYAAHKETEQWWLPWRIYDYSVQQRPDWDPALVLRLSYVYISARKLSHMMRIPPRILKNNELNWRIRCEQTANLDVDDGVDWDQFDFNIAGYKETILPPTDLPEDKPEDRPG